MGFWNANSDRDWYDECHGPYPRRVERTCATCHRLFLMTVEGDYVMHPECDRCAQQERNRHAKAEQERDTPIKRGAA